MIFNGTNPLSTVVKLVQYTLEETVWDRRKAFRPFWFRFCPNLKGSQLPQNRPKITHALWRIRS
jgi:hypothetical protein